jgi:threonine dehydratase
MSQKALLSATTQFARAQRQLWEVAHIVVEPGGATDLAALASGKYRPRRRRAGRGAAVRANTAAVDFAR